MTTTPTINPFEVPTMPAKTRAPATAFATIWKDPTTSHKGLLTYTDGKEIALRDEDAVARATNPAPYVLQDTPEDRAILDDWLEQPINGPLPTKHPYLAVPAALVREILGWDV